MGGDYHLAAQVHKQDDVESLKNLWEYVQWNKQSTGCDAELAEQLYKHDDLWTQ